MRVAFSGPFPTDNSLVDATQEHKTVPRWQCCICYMWNEAVSAPTGSEEEDLTCRVCARPQRPEWLHLEKQDFQIRLGSLLTLSHTQSASGTQQLQQLGVVTAIDYVAKQLQVLSVRRSNHVNSNTTLHEPHQHQQLRFTEVVVHQREIQELEPFSHTSHEPHDWSDLLAEYGICGDCRCVFHISQGDLQSNFASEELISSLCEEIATLQMNKHRQIRENDCALVLETTSEIHAKQQQLQLVRRQLEFLSPLFCPFCGWRT